MRLGTWYRKHALAAAGIAPSGDRALEVGCHDGLLLAGMPFRLRVGADLAPAPRPLVPVVKADGCRLPFAAGSFDAVLAFDILEHVADDAELLASILRVLRTGGVLWLSTPTDRFSITPAWLGRRLQRGWGHLRVGYSVDALRRILPAGSEMVVSEWNEPGFRLLWLPLRLLWTLARPLAREATARVACWDGARSAGGQGHYFVRIRRASGESDAPDAAAGEVWPAGSGNAASRLE